MPLIETTIRAMADISAGLLDVLYPPVCGLCGKPADSEDRLVCQKCWDAIEGLQAPYCSECKTFITAGKSCPTCRPAPLTIISLGYYDAGLQAIIHDLKFYGFRPLANQLGAKLAANIEKANVVDKIDAIIPVPLHPTRLLMRGFNQAEEIALAIGRKLGLPVIGDLLYLTRRTRQQARLSATERVINVRGAYAAGKKRDIIIGKAVLLVDDVTTTGATLRETARVLKKAGVKSIIAAVAATAL